MARRPRPRKRCKRSRARRLVIRKKLEQKQEESQVQSNSATDYTEDSSEVTFNRLLEEHRKTYIKPCTDAGKDEQLELISDSDEACEGPDDPDYFPDLIVEKSKDEEDSKITGRRIVDINHLLKQMQHVVGHSKICTMGKFTFQREVVNGTFSTFVYFCDNCEKEYMMTSEPDATKNECNDALVWGALSVGIGYSQIEELFGVMNIPVMGQNKYKSHERKIGQAWEDILVNKMKENAEEEKRIALEKGNIFQGKPFITVIGDGGWAKRSYGHGMNSSSGVVREY